MPRLDPDRLGLLPISARRSWTSASSPRPRGVRGGRRGGGGVGDHRCGAEAGLGPAAAPACRARKAGRAACTRPSAPGGVRARRRPAGLAKAWRVIGSVHGTRCATAGAPPPSRTRSSCARLGGDRPAGAALRGGVRDRVRLRPMPSRGDRALPGDRAAAAGATTAPKGSCSARVRSSRRSRELRRRQAALPACAVGAVRVGGSVLAASTALDSSKVEMLAGEPAPPSATSARLRAARADGERYLLSTMTGVLAQALIAQGRHDEAAGAVRRAEASLLADDLESHVLVPCRPGRAATSHAGRLADAAVAIAAATECSQGVEAPKRRRPCDRERRIAAAGERERPNATSRGRRRSTGRRATSCRKAHGGGAGGARPARSPP